MACRRATWPTRISPSLLKPTTDGVIRLPSSFSITLGSRPSMIATTELVVPRSMPMIFFAIFSLSPENFFAAASRVLPRCGGTVSTQGGVSRNALPRKPWRRRLCKQANASAGGIGSRSGWGSAGWGGAGGARGGMGEVWLPELQGDGAFRRRVVLKVFAPERVGDARVATMLADEARVVGLLHHPGIVAALDYLETEEHGPVFVLEFVDGASLRTVLKLARRQNAVLPEALAAHIGAQVAHALHAAHTALGRDGKPMGVVHRDVSPDNVLLSRSGAVYLGDFGVARAVGNAELMHPGAGPKGKLGYMAPEQARDKKVGPEADIFALGRVIAEAADLSCGPALRAVVDRATAEKPRDRFESASEMAAALIHACPPPTDPDRELAEWLRRYAWDALVERKTSPGEAPRSDPPPAGRPPGTH